MEEIELDEGRTVKRLSDFLPSDLRMEIFRAVKEAAKRSLVKPSLERFVGVDLWNIKEEEALERYSHRILAFALTNIPQVREIIRKDFLGEIKCLCEDLGLITSGERELKGVERNNREKFMEHIDGRSREIIWYLLRNRHAGIRELTDLTGETDMEVLTRIREVINPAAKKFIGEEIMEFKRSKIDESSGKKAVFKWWLRDNLQLIEKREEIIDVFDEPDQIRIIAELPSTVEERDIKVEMNNNDIVSIIGKAPNGRYERKIPLFYAVEKVIEKTYKNRILAIRLIKKRKGIENEVNGAGKN